MATAYEAAARGKTVLGHPRGLFLLFFTEMWERFSYYGMRAILVFYLTKHFLFTDEPAFGIYAAYTSLVYVTPSSAAIWPTAIWGPGVRCWQAGCSSPSAIS